MTERIQQEPEEPAAVKERLRRALAMRTRVPMAPGPVPAAVLIPLFLSKGEFHILLTKRTSHMTHHRGEISFPGGVREPGDLTSAETALRETWEEVGIRREDVEILGALDDCASIHNYLVTPFVGCFPPDYQLTINYDEIERIIEVPLSHLSRPEFSRTEYWPWQGGMRPMYFYRYREDEIWGLTARILKQFLDVLHGTELCEPEAVQPALSDGGSGV